MLDLSFGIVDESTNGWRFVRWGAGFVERRSRWLAARLLAVRRGCGVVCGGGRLIVGAVEVRELGVGDAAAWWRLRLESLEREPAAFGKSLDEHRASTVEDAARQFVDAPEGSFHLGAFDGENLVGMMRFVRESGEKERHKGRVFGTYVTAAQRGRGVGRALLGALVERARRDASLEQILLGVAVGQVAAQRLYAEFGFTRFGTEPRALKIGAEYVDEHHLVLLLA